MVVVVVVGMCIFIQKVFSCNRWESIIFLNTRLFLQHSCRNLNSFYFFQFVQSTCSFRSMFLLESLGERNKTSLHAMNTNHDPLSLVLEQGLGILYYCHDYYWRCAGDVTAIGEDNEINETSSRFVLVCCVQFRTNTFGKTFRVLDTISNVLLSTQVSDLVNNFSSQARFSFSLADITTSTISLFMSFQGLIDLSEAQSSRSTYSFYLSMAECGFFYMKELKTFALFSVSPRPC